MALDRRRPSRFLSPLVLVLAVAGCHGGSPRTAAASSQSSVTTASPTKTKTATPPACPNEPATARRLTLTTNDNLTLPATEIGTGPRGVLFVPETGSQGECGWMPYADDLAAKGLHILLMGEADVSAVDTALNELHSNGAMTIVVVGASTGATKALAAEAGSAADSAPGVAAVVALSADELGNLPAEAPTIHVPVLMAVADDDAYVSTADERGLFDALAVPPSLKTLDVRPGGTGHGWDLLADEGFKHTVTDFITAHLAADYTVWGTGARTIVLSNQSDEDQWSWQAYADHLVAEGYKVVMWDYTDQDPVKRLQAMVADLRAHGAGPVFLLGASKGGKTSLVAAAGIKPPVTAVVTLSAESTLTPGIDVSSYVKQLTCPVLLLTAAQDGYGSADAAKTFQADLPNLAHTLSYDGADHGTQLLSGADGAKVIADVDAFLKAH
jgi:dienelactone hydrolase